jgi:hypothetical protein
VAWADVHLGGSADEPRWRPAVLTASLRALDGMNPEPSPAEHGLAPTYERYAGQLAEIEALRSSRQVPGTQRVQ